MKKTSILWILALFFGLAACQKETVEPDWADDLVGQYYGNVYVNRQMTTEVANFTLTKTGAKTLQFKDAEGTCEVTITNKLQGASGTEYSATSTSYFGTYQGTKFTFTPYNYDFGTFQASAAYSVSTKEFAIMFNNSRGSLIGIIGKK